MKKKLIIGLVIGAAVFGAVYAVAASLSVSTNTLQSGSDTTLGDFQCDTDGVTTSYTVAWDSTDSRYEVNGVTITGIADPCNAKNFSVTLTGTGGGLPVTKTLNSQTITGAGSTNDRSVSFTVLTSGGSDDNALASGVTDVHVAIYS